MQVTSYKQMLLPFLRTDQESTTETATSAKTPHAPAEAPAGYLPNPFAGAPHQPEFIREKPVHDPNNFYRGYC